MLRSALSQLRKAARGPAHHFLNEGNGKRHSSLFFSMKEWTAGAPLFTLSMKEQAAGSAHHFLNEGKGDGFHSSLSQ